MRQFGVYTLVLLFVGIEKQKSLIGNVHVTSAIAERPVEVVICPAAGNFSA